MNKSLEKLAMLVVILWCVSLVPSPLMHMVAARMYSPQEYMEFNALRTAYAAGSILLGLSVHIGVAAWLFIQVRRNGGTPWIWTLLGLATGLTAVLLYWLGEIREQLVPKEKTEANHCVHSIADSARSE
jgi:hypothetical protein